MNKIKNILLITIITATLFLGTTIVPMQSHAGENKNTKDYKSSIKASTESDKKSASQHQDQDNFCYRGDDDCQQANEGQQIVGKDNEAKGFNDQSLHVQQAATPTQPLTPIQPPTPTATLNICKTVNNNAPGATFQPSDFTYTFSTPANPSTFQGNNEGCTAVTVAPGTFTFKEFWPPSVTGGTQSPSGGCEIINLIQPPAIVTFNGTIAADETQTCTLINTVSDVNTEG